MLSYRHSYHAGNFADVFKHLILLRLLEAFTRKPNPFFVLDTHAGAGVYALSNAHAQKLREYEQGIGRLWSTGNVPAGYESYLDAVQGLNPDGLLRCYPGSAWLIARYLRPGDRAACAELHPTDFPLLQAALQGRRGMSVQQSDGFAAIKALLPPAEKRGLLFIDPPYERDEEWDQVVRAVAEADARFRQGVTAIWYPRLAGRATDRFLRRLQALAIPKTCVAEIAVNVPAQRGMYGSGMALVNPPWGLFESLPDWMPGLTDLLAQSAGASWRAEWLVPESPSR